VPFKTWSPGDVLTAADVNAYLMRQTKAVCTSGSRPSSPVTGQEIFETDTGLTQRWNGTAWTPWPPVPVQVEDLTNFSATSTVYVTGVTCATTFIAGPTGVAVVTVGGYLQAASTVVAALSFELRLTNSAGAQFLAPSDANALQSQNVDNMQACYRTLVTGMTPGQTYYIRAWHRVSSAGSITINARRLIVEPWAN
jgi:hypothetical protein